MGESSKNNILKEKFQYLNEYAKIKYDSELRREDSIIQQASQMQTAFSFMTAALFMVAPVVIQYRGEISLYFFLLSFSTITTALLFSLLMATLAQNRSKTETFADIDVFVNFMKENEKSFETEEQRKDYLINTYGKVQLSKAKLNDKRVAKVRTSMYSFYVALALCAFWFIVAIVKMI